MPASKICKSCQLVFAVGWFHYHEFKDYPAATYLVCTACGTTHLLKYGRTYSIPITKKLKWFSRLFLSFGRLVVGKKDLKFPKDLYATGVSDKLFSQPEPMFLQESNDKYDFFIETMFKEWIDCDLESDLRLFREHSSCEITEGCDATLRLNVIQCNYCKEKGALTEKWPSAFQHCPSCEERSVIEYSTWMT
ncbi:MAG: hypothetical protein ACYSUT_12860 [Planctomycetota bacterium]|jgi:hypothetical protein